MDTQQTVVEREPNPPNKKGSLINVVMAIIITAQLGMLGYIVFSPSPGQKPANVLILQDNGTEKQIFEVDNAIVQNYGTSVRVIGQEETYVFDSSKVVVVKNPTQETRKKFWDLLKFK